MFTQIKRVQPKKMKTSTFEDTPLVVRLLTAGSAACVADVCTFPLDTAKVRLQVQGEGEAEKARRAGFRYRGVFNTIGTIAREEGPKRLYNGLAAGLQRQMCFASVRLGLYDTFKNIYQTLTNGPEDKNSLGFLPRVCAGITTGGLAVLLAQPTDVVKVRFQAELGKEERYKSTSEAYRNIFKNEGARGLWKGTFPNIVRNSIVNVSEIVCYDIVKDIILQKRLMKDNTVCHFMTAFIAGFCATVTSSPVDVIKTRYMNSPPGKYKSALDCTINTIKQEGLTALYKGFLPSFYRLVSWNIAMWITYEKFKVFVPKTLNFNS